MDIKLVLGDFSGDLQMSGFDLAVDNSLETAVVVSLFSDRRAEPDDLLPGGDDDRRGWWADTFAEIDGDQFGSRLWLLSREKQLDSVVSRAREYAEEALAWLVDDGVAAEVIVTAFVAKMGVLSLGVDIIRPDGSKINYTFDHIWEAMRGISTTGA